MARGRSRPIRWRWLAAAVLVVLAGCRPGGPPEPLPLNGPDLRTMWTYEAGAPINQVPLRAADVVVVVPSGGALTALDAETGERRWDYDPPEGVWERSYASDGRMIYIGVGGGDLAALQAETGDVVWRRRLGIEVQHPPLVGDGRLYVPTTFVGPGLRNDHGAHAVLFALEAATGEAVWSFETENYILQTPAVHGTTVFLAGNYWDPRPVDQGGHTRVYALDSADGEVRWIHESEDGFVKRLHPGGSTVALVGYQDFVSGLDAGDGRLRWRHNAGNWVPSIAGDEARVYFGSANTVVHALEMASGDVVWQHNLPGGTFNYVLGSPVVVGDDLYLLTQHGDIVCLDVRTGELRWEHPTGITSRVGMLLSGDRVFIGDENGVVYAFAGP